MSPKNQQDQPARKVGRKTKSLFAALQNVVKADTDEKKATYSRQVDYDDAFGSAYTDGKTVLAPPYLPNKMYELYEESGILQACVEAYVTNIDGYGHDILPMEGAAADQDEAENIKQEFLKDFFSEPNPEQSFVTLRQKVRRDFEVTGNGYIEVVRSLDSKPSLMFWADAKRTRLCPLEKTQVEVDSFVKRGGERIPVKLKKRFRKYAMLLEGAAHSGDGSKNFRYFKEYGDPRPMNALTGEYLTDTEQDSANKTGFVDEQMEQKFLEATEIIHFKFGNGTYGVPRWIGTLLAVMGLNRAEFVNFDLFDGQGIPPLLVTVSGGELSESSFDDLIALFTKAKGAENFSKMLLLEAESTSTDLNGREVVPQLHIQDLMEYRKEDAMFLNYMDDARKTIRQYGFRLPGMFVGETTDYNYATAKVARETAEEQVFVPERKAFDEIINKTIIRDLDITEFVFTTKAPIIRSNEELLDVLPTLTEKGAFTVNELIEFVNEYFGTTLKQYEDDDAEWANRPIPEALSTLTGGGLDLDLPPETGVDDVDEFQDEEVEKIYTAVLKLEAVASNLLKGEAHAQHAEEAYTTEAL